MTPERWQRIKQLFGEAAALAPDTRAAFLDAACAGDAELRAEVQSLLAASTEDALVDMPAAAYLTGAGFRAGAEQWIGQRLGPYELTSLLGHGGMGEVYRARRVDAEYDKEVAIKLVPAGYQAEYVLHRLRTERQILATLEHPNIARLIDGGASAQGIPYLVMELVDGQPIDRYCANLPIERRIDLFRDVCGAVSYAHQRLVVHRDLKPSNILVTADGQPKLLDFGIAKLLRPSAGDVTQPAVTQLHTFTPQFASPEQVLGQPITTASDVYSLGVLLYLLLSGRSPYRGRLDTTQDAIREICEGEPAAPGVSPDLDAICLRALRKEPEKRYASVEQFSDDLHRYLRGLPVSARGNQFGYRAGKFLRRHKLEMGAAALFVLTLVGGIVFSMREARLAEAQRVRAEKHFQSVRNLADTFMFKVHDAIAPIPGTTEARGLLVDTSLEYLNTLAQEAGDDPSLQLDLANAYLKVGNVQGEAYGANTGKQRDAIESYRRSTELADRVLAGKPDDVAAMNTLRDGLRALASLTMQLDGPQAALEFSTRGVQVSERLRQIDPGRDAELESARMKKAHGIALDYAGREQESRDFGQQAITMLEQLRADAPDDMEVAQQLSSAYTSVGTTILGVEHDDAALALSYSYRLKGLEFDRLVFERLPARAREVDMLRALYVDNSNLMEVLNYMERYDEALPYCEAARRWIEQLRVDAKNAQTNIDEAMLNAHCARTLRGLERFEESERLSAQNLALLERMSRDSDNLYVQFYLGATKDLLGSAAERRGDCRQALGLYRSALEHFAPVTSAATLDFKDTVLIKGAKAGVARLEAEPRCKS